MNKCPKCGYCDKCGRSGYPAYPYPNQWVYLPAYPNTTPYPYPTNTYPTTTYNTTN